jgi:hypothetical protein
MKHKLTLTIDGPAFFDAVQKIGQETAGSRLLETCLQASTGKLKLHNHLGLSIYGIEASLEENGEVMLDAEHGAEVKS